MEYIINYHNSEPTKASRRQRPTEKSSKVHSKKALYSSPDSISNEALDLNWIRFQIIIQFQLKSLLNQESVKFWKCEQSIENKFGRLVWSEWYSGRL